MPLQYLIALFIGLPIVELALLIRIHGMVGFMPTFGLVILTGVIGASLVRRQGLSILLRIQQEMSKGNLPAPQMMDGVMILIAGALLVTPGLITDFTGFALLIPFVRKRIRFWLRDKLKEKMDSGYIQVNVHRSDHFPGA